MLVRDRMTSPVITVEPQTSLDDALTLMKKKRIRRLPVLKGRRLVGIVTRTDLMRAQPPPASALTVWEAPALLLKAPVAEVMTTQVVTIRSDATVEDAAVMMRQHKVGGLPVVDDGTLVGIITESDLFDAFIDLMGLRRGGARLTIDVPDDPASVDEIVHAIRDCRVRVHSLAVYPLNGRSQMVVRVDAPYPLHVLQTLAEQGFAVRHLAALPERPPRSRKEQGQ